MYRKERYLCSGLLSQLTWRGLILSLLMVGLLLQLVAFSDVNSSKPELEEAARFPSFQSSLPGRQTLNVIIVSSTPRSGSSYTGELISASHDSSFFFEPLWYFLDSHIGTPNTQMKEMLFKNLLRCNMRDHHIRKILFSAKQSSFIFRKPSTSDLLHDSLLNRYGVQMSYIYKMEARCRRTRIRVIKTIRMRIGEVADFIDSLPEEGVLSRYNTYLIYLVRDPRGVINSIQDLEMEWPSKLKRPSHICSRILNDSVFLNQSIPYLHVVRYEDVASDPWNFMVHFFQQLNQTLPKEVKHFVHQHSAVHWDKTTTKESEKAEVLLQPKNTSKQSKREKRMTKEKLFMDPDGRSYYYSTYRNPQNFSPNHWRTKLSKKRQDEINSDPACIKVFDIFNYPPS